MELPAEGLNCLKNLNLYEITFGLPPLTPSFLEVSTNLLLCSPIQFYVFLQCTFFMQKPTRSAVQLNMFWAVKFWL
jgi:hypothetical protein